MPAHPGPGMLFRRALCLPGRLRVGPEVGPVTASRLSAQQTRETSLLPGKQRPRNRFLGAPEALAVSGVPGKPRYCVLVPPGEFWVAQPDFEYSFTLNSSFSANIIFQIIKFPWVSLVHIWYKTDADHLLFWFHSPFGIFMFPPTIHAQVVCSGFPRIPANTTSHSSPE